MARYEPRSMQKRLILLLLVDKGESRQRCIDEGGILQKGPVTSERGQYPLSNAIPWLGLLFEAMAAPAGQIRVRCDVMHLWRLSPLSTRSSKIYLVLEPLLHRAVHTSP